MAKKKIVPKREPAAPSRPEPQALPARSQSWWENPWLSALVLVAATAVVYAGSIHNGFVFFDDDKAILYNPALQSPSLSKFFHGENLGMYAPITWIGYWIGYSLSGTDAWGYHALGLLVHAANTVLVFLLIRQLLQRHWPAFFVATLFALHPIQVEAVSWAAALSTVLFAFFYLLSAHAYLRWKGSPTPLWYGLSLAAFVLACLSKSAAVTLPLVLLALDFYFSKKLVRKFWLSKIPYFLLSLTFGAYTFITREQEGHDIATASSVFSFVDRFWMVCQTLLFYPVKLLLPLEFSISYPFVKSGGVWPWPYYAAPVVLAVLAFLVWKYWRQRPELLLAIALYLLPLCVMLPFRTVGSFELRSDRYVYLSGLGLFLILALFLEQQKPALRNGLLAVAAVVCGFLTMQQTTVWKDGIALFKNCVDKTPEASLCQCNLAYSELLNLDFQNSAFHYTEALKYDPSTVEAYNGRGQAYFQLKKIPDALSDFDHAIAAGIVTPKLFLNRGKCLVMLGRPADALPDLDRSIELEPKSPEAFFFRAVVYEKAKDPAKAMENYSKAIELKPDYIESIVNRALLQVNAQQYAAAIEDYTRALGIRPNMEMIFNNRGYAYFKNGQIDKALADVNQALSLNPRYAKAYQTRAVIYQQSGQAAKAQADLDQVQRLQQGQ